MASSKPGYGPAPWEFRGQALYQLSLVRVEEARKYLPPGLPLVNCFGWTLGGFYLARYSHSPVGPFDELVALAGLAWNFPTSAAWAGRLFVNNREAKRHGIQKVGLPSQLGRFVAVPALPTLGAGGRVPSRQQQQPSWWDVGGRGGSSAERPTAVMELHEDRPWLLLGRLGSGAAAVRFSMPCLPKAWAPSIQMFLPSYSGATPSFPGLVQYSLRMQAKVRPIAPLRISFPAEEEGGPGSLAAMLGGRPLVCLSFEDMHMVVQAPTPWFPKRREATAGGGGGPRPVPA